MPDQTISDLFQRAVLWPILSVDGYGGPVISIPSEIPVRWKWGFTNMLNPKRETITVDATVRVDQEIVVDSLIWLGKLTDISNGTLGPDLQTPSGLCQVKAIKHTPDIDNRFQSRTLGVIRFRGPLPTVPGVG